MTKTKIPRPASSAARRVVALFERVSDFVYTVASFTLFAFSLGMIADAVWEAGVAIHGGERITTRLLDGIGLIVIAVAVFDVAKYLMEEEVIRERELRSPSEARQTLTKFLVIITIAVSLESLVFVFDAGKADITTLVYPSLLLAVAVLLVVGMGLYLRLSLDVERKTLEPGPIPDGETKAEREALSSDP